MKHLWECLPSHLIYRRSYTQLTAYNAITIQVIITPQCLNGYGCEPYVGLWLMIRVSLCLTSSCIALPCHSYSICSRLEETTSNINMSKRHSRMLSNSFWAGWMVMLGRYEMWYIDGMYIQLCIYHFSVYGGNSDYGCTNRHIYLCVSCFDAREWMFRGGCLYLTCTDFGVVVHVSWLCFVEGQIRWWHQAVHERHSSHA